MDVNLIAAIVTEYFGIDLAISKNKEYLAEKVIANQAIPREFNMTKGLSIKTAMPRIVLPIAPKVMEIFATQYMSEITSSQSAYIDRWKVLNIFKNACSQKSVSAQEVIANILARTSPIIL